jgi:hypothetical protein
MTRSRCAELIIAKLFQQAKSSKILQIVAQSSFSLPDVFAKSASERAFSRLALIAH